MGPDHKMSRTLGYTFFLALFTLLEAELGLGCAGVMKPSNPAFYVFDS